MQDSKKKIIVLDCLGNCGDNGQRKFSAENFCAV